MANLKKQLVDAHATSRTLKNRLYEIESKHLAALNEEQARRRDAEREAQEADERALAAADELARAQAQLAQRSTYRPLSDAELIALAATVMTESLLVTPARKRLLADLEHRGIVAVTDYDKGGT